jgi:hypothetical protein
MTSAEVIGYGVRRFPHILNEDNGAAANHGTHRHASVLPAETTAHRSCRRGLLRCGISRRPMTASGQNCPYSDVRGLVRSTPNTHRHTGHSKTAASCQFRTSPLVCFSRGLVAARPRESLATHALDSGKFQ